MKNIISEITFHFSFLEVLLKRLSANVESNKTCIYIRYYYLFFLTN